MRSYFAAFCLAMVVAAILTPLVRWLAVRLGAVAPPGGRHVHVRTIPRLGGIALALAVAAPVVALLIVDSGVARIVSERSGLAVALLVGGIALCGIGVVDDIRGVRAAYKLAVQVGAATLAYACGFRIDAIHLPLVGALPMGVFALPVTVLWIVGITNAVNLIDGLDGLAAGVVFFAACTNFAIAWISKDVLAAAVTASMMGALLGFLFYNFNPARIFMGDSGSYFLGFVLGTTSLISHKTSAAVSLLVPVVALGLPIFDTLFSMVRRALERRPLFSPDRGHIHHRLLDMGITHRRAVIILYGVSVTLTVAAIGISLGRQWEIGVALVFATVVMVGLVRFVGYFEYLRSNRSRGQGAYDEHAQMLRRTLPHLMARLANIQTAADIWEELVAAAREMDLGSVEVARASKEQLVYRWQATPVDDRRGEVIARPVGLSGRFTVRFMWRSESATVAPETDILLQVLTDAVERALLGVDGELASVAAEKPRVVASGLRSAVLATPAKPE